MGRTNKTALEDDASKEPNRAVSTEAKGEGRAFSNRHRRKARKIIRSMLLWIAHLAHPTRTELNVQLCGSF